MNSDEIKRAAIEARMGMIGPLVRCSMTQLHEFAEIVIQMDRKKRKPIDEALLEDMWGESVSIKKPDFDNDILEFARNIEKAHKIA